MADRTDGSGTVRVSGDLPVVGVVDEGLGNTSWFADLDGEGVVVDPARDPAPYLATADERSVPIVLTAETHLHADFVTGSRELAAGGAGVLAAAAGGLTWPHHPLRPYEEVDLGRWRLRTLPTPGHTPEHLAYLLLHAGQPRAVFTGGALLVGAVARTDLIDPADTESLTRALWHSINRELLALPDDVAVLPTHGAGSFCTAAGSGRRWTTIGGERRANPLLQVDDEDHFVRAVLAGFGSYPPYFRRLREVNRLGPTVLGGLPLLPTLTVEQARSHQELGAVVVDVRPVADYARGHIRGSLANTLRPQFSTWLGWLVDDPGTPLVFVTDAHVDRRELVRQCVTIGYEHLVGEITIDDWRAAGGEIATTPLLAPADLGDQHVVDVRQDSEFEVGHVPGATNVELGRLPAAVADVGSDPVVLMCGHGERAATGASVLEAAGRQDVAILDGGPGEWARAHDRGLASA